MSKLEKIFIVARFVLVMIGLTILVVFGASESMRNDNLESQNMALQTENIMLQDQIVALQYDVKMAKHKKAQLAKKVTELRNEYWAFRYENSTLRDRVSDLRRGLPFWESNYDAMVSQNLGHKYRSWPFNLSDQLLVALGTMAQIGPEGHDAASWRFVALKAQVKTAIKAGLGYGWEKMVLADFQANTL